MIQANPASTARIAGHPIHPMLVPFPIVCFTGALLTDIAYARTADIMWSNFSVWLLAAGMIMAVLAALAGMIDFIGNRRVRAQKPPGRTFGQCGRARSGLVEQLHPFSRDAWTSVVPTGLVLSALTVALLLVTAWLGWSLVYRHGVGVAECRPRPPRPRPSALVLGLAACDAEPFDRNAQIGPDPKLPEQNQYLCRPCAWHPWSRWNDGATPSVPPEPAGPGLRDRPGAPALRLHAAQRRRAGGRGAEPRHRAAERPKDLIMGWMQSYASGGGGPGPSNRITLLRDADGDGTPEVRTLFIDHLNSPYGVALVGGDLYVAATDALLRFPYRDGRDQITAPPTVLTDAARRPDRPPLDQEPGGKPGRLEALCRRRLEQQYHRERPGGGALARGDLGGRPRHRRPPDLRRAACAIPTA